MGKIKDQLLGNRSFFLLLPFFLLVACENVKLLDTTIPHTWEDLANHCDTIVIKNKIEMCCGYGKNGTKYYNCNFERRQDSLKISVQLGNVNSFEFEIDGKLVMQNAKVQNTLGSADFFDFFVIKGKF